MKQAFYSMKSHILYDSLFLNFCSWESTTKSLTFVEMIWRISGNKIYFISIQCVSTNAYLALFFFFTKKIYDQ